MTDIRKKAGHAGRYLLPALAGAALVLTGCGKLETAAVQTGFVQSPYYQLGDTDWDHGGIEEYYFNQVPSSLNEIYRELYSRISNYEDSADLYAMVPLEDFWTAYYSLLADHPEFFWIGSNIEVQQDSLSGKVVHYQLTSTVPAEDRDAMKAELEAAADAVIASIPEGYSEYGMIKHVYEYLIDTVDYDSASRDNQNVQSALLYRASVCAGYSRAFQYIMHRMDRFCTYVTGKTAAGGDHAWNIVRIDGTYYNVDVTWGDPVFVNAEEGTQYRVKNYNYLCCTDADLAATHTAQAQVTLPVCNDSSYDYYRINGMYYETFHYDEVYNALMNSVWNDRSSVTMKFGSAEAYASAVYELFSNGMVQDAAQYLMNVNGVSSWNYRYNTDEDFNLITIYWKS